MARATDNYTLGDLEVEKFDANTLAVNIMDYAHHEIHSGSHYFYKGVVPFNGGAAETQYLMFITPDTDARVHAKASIYGSLEFDIEIYEGATVSANGTELETFNNDRDSTNTPGLVAYSGPTVTDEGTLIWKGKTGSGRTPATVAPGTSYEIIAKRNSIYLFKLVKVPSNTAYIDADFWWYEHAPKN